jgi:hypothetical protein
MSRSECKAYPTQIVRLLTREEAARYCSISVQTFSHWVNLRRLPPPIDGTKRWDLKAIDLALDSLSGLATAESFALDEWKMKRARRSEGNS